MTDIQPGDRVRIAKAWATSNAPTSPGTVKRVINTGWVSVRFDGHREDWIGMARELEPS